MEQVSYSNEIIVPINDKKVKVCKLGLISYAKMSNLLKEVILSILELLQKQAELRLNLNDNNLSEATQLADIFSNLLEKNVDQVIKLINLCVPELDILYIEQKVGLEDCLSLFDAILKVNNISKVITQSKKLWTNLMGGK